MEVEGTIEQMIECLLVEIRINRDRMKAKIGAEVKTIQEKMDDGQEEMKARMCYLTSWINASQEEMRVRVSAIQYKMEVMIKCCQETEATIHSIRSELEEAIKHWVEDVLSCVNQKMQGLRKELTEKIVETQVDLQAVKTSICGPGV